MSVDVNQVFKDLQEFIRNYQGDPIFEMPVGVSVSPSGNLHVKYTTYKIVHADNIEQAAEVIQNFLHEQLIKTLKN